MAKSLAATTVGELDRVIEGFASTAPAEVIPIEQVVAALRHRVAAVDAWTETLLERVDEVEVEVVEEVRDRLLEVVAGLDEVLG